MALSRVVEFCGRKFIVDCSLGGWRVWREEEEKEEEEEEEGRDIAKRGLILGEITRRSIHVGVPQIAI